MHLAPLNVAALFDQVADLVRRDRELALGTDIQSGRDQEVVAPSVSLRRLGFASFRYGHDSLPRDSSRAIPLGEKSLIIGSECFFSSPRH